MKEKSRKVELSRENHTKMINLFSRGNLMNKVNLNLEK